MGTDRGDGFALPAVSFLWTPIHNNGFRIYAFDQTSYNEGYAQGFIDGSGVVHGAPPTITVISPPEEDTIGRTIPLVFSVVADSAIAALRRVVVSVSYGGEIEELVHNGTTFSGGFSGGLNARVNVANGYRFTILRFGGWRAGPILLRVSAIDIIGQIGQKTLANPQAVYVWTVAG